MNQRVFPSVGIALITLSLLAGPAWAQPASPDVAEPETAEAAVERVRALYFMRDFEGAQIEGVRLLDRFPESRTLKAWALLSRARNDDADAAVAEAEQLVAAAPDDPWSHFALVGALCSHRERGDEALAASEHMLALQPDHPDFLWLRAQVLVDHEDKERVIAFVDEHRGQVEHPAKLLNLKGYGLYMLSRDSEGAYDEATFDESLQVYAEARALDSTNVSAIYLPGYQLMATRRTAEAYPFLKKAASLSLATRIHQYYWRTVMGLADRTLDEKRAEIEADIEALLNARPASPGVLLAIANQYGELDLADRKAAIEKQILREHPATEEAEWVLVNRYRDFASEHREQLLDDPDLKASYVTMLRDFIARPQHVQDRLLGDAYRELFEVTKEDPSVSDDALLEIIHGMVEYEGINPHVTHAGGAKALADRKTHFREAERIARLGIEAGRKRIEENRDYYDTEGDYEQALNWMISHMYDALGWVYFNEGRLAEAEDELLRAYDMNPENPDNLYHLGRLYEQQVRLDEAETYYIKGAMVSTPGTNPNDEALLALYEARHGTLEGFDDYTARLAEIDRERRRKEVLESRIEAPDAADPFALKTLDGDVYASEVLEGKIAVINFWGVWCGWCVKEMPEYQELHEAYEADPDVVILTINNDANPDEVRAWMEEHAYTFPVLRDDGYASKAGVFAFPTTWFLDREGRKAFVKQGWSEKLLEEFSWRIEALR